MRHDDHGDRMKAYEAAADRRLDIDRPIYARIDGRGFSRFTRGMARPFDRAMSDAMVATTAGLVERTHARVGYTQSDEISLVFLAKEGGDVVFSGRLAKLTSVLAALATALFTRELMTVAALEPYRARLPHFDCRVCQLPDVTEVANMIVWRYKDATRNAVQLASRAAFPHRALHGKSNADMLTMLAGAGVDFTAYPAAFRRGVFVRRRSVLRELTADEMARIPERHRPVGPVVRSETVAVDCGDFLALKDRERFVMGEDAPT